METLKRALSETMRAIAEQKDLHVTFSGSAPLMKNKASLIPLPSSAFTLDEIAKSRGAAGAECLVRQSSQAAIVGASKVATESIEPMRIRPTYRTLRSVCPCQSRCSFAMLC